MNSKNFKLPALPKIPSAPKSTLTTASQSSSGVSKLALGDSIKTTPINFGRPSQAFGKTSPSSSQWSNLLTQTTSGGLAGALSSVAGFGGGIASIISGLTSLFGGGGKSAPPPLVEFQLPASQQQLITIGGAPSAPGNYSSPQSVSSAEHQSAQIIQTVRQALLNSSSLNDVIADI
jgi:hypothetical protein